MRLSPFAPTGRKKFARNLLEIRSWHCLSEEEVAAGCRFAASKVRALERAATEPEHPDLIKLATVLRVSLNRLLIGIKPRDFRLRNRPTLKVLTEIEAGDRAARLSDLVYLANALDVLPTALVKGATWQDGVLEYKGQSIEE